MRFTPHLLDEIRARLPVSTVVARKVALKKKGREFVGLSPFKSEKTPSFFVNDQKGFYHCFASGEHGDIFKFVMSTEGLSFPEAVERLAQEAGVTLPKADARDEVRADLRERLMSACEAAAAFFIAQLAGPAGAEARRYVTEKRGLRRETIERFRIGYAPASKSALKDHLGQRGFSVEEMVSAGLLIAGDDIPVPYDRFRNRVMFPIADLKGRIVAFGGRALEAGEHTPKYLNSPETPLFHKGHMLYNAHQARAAAHDKDRVIAVEGYMDVVALTEGGFAESVAPLGTALTEDQVKLLWRMVPEPTLCFDGDSAGKKAAHRAVDTVLPHLKPGTSVSFAFLPDGLDPDDLIRQRGASSMEAVLAEARPLVDVLWDREWASGTWNTPERRARFELQIKALVARIEDNAVRGHYEREIRQRLAAAFGGAPVARAPQDGGEQAGYRGSGRQVPQSGSRTGQAGTGQAFKPRGSGGAYARPQGRRSWPPSPYDIVPPPAAGSALRTSRLAVAEAHAPAPREILLLLTILHPPWLLVDHAEEVAGLDFAAPALSRLRDAILSEHASETSLDSARLRSQLSRAGVLRTVELIDRATSHKSDRFAEPDAPRDEVEAGWRHALALQERQSGLTRSLQAAERAWHEDGSEEALARIVDIQRQMALAHRLGHDEEG